MSCTTVLAGKKATYDGSTMIARNEDSFFEVKKMIVVKPSDQPRKYKSKISKLEIELPDNPLRYTACPNADGKNGIWAASGINGANVGMTATETITSNPLVMGADPYVIPEKGKVGGIGEEDMVTLVLPYIHSAREGVERLGSLLEKYGTYEPNGIAFNDEDEVWWLETIGGHHWMAVRIQDDSYAIIPNQLGIDHFDFADAYGKKKNYMCSADLKQFMEDNHLNLDKSDKINPRHVFGSHSDSDHVYNTPRSWYMGRYFNPDSYKWEGEKADFGPESDDIPFSMVPDRLITVEDIKYVLSSYYQGTPYNPYNKGDDPRKGHYRPIGINRTGVMTICQIRGYMPEQLKGLEWVCFASNAFNTMMPLYADVEEVPRYLSNVTTEVSTDNFYWSSRLMGALADPHYGNCIQHIERYQYATASKGHQLISEYDRRMQETGDYSLRKEANNKVCEMVRELTVKTLAKVLHEASVTMKNGYSRADN